MNGETNIEKKYELTDNERKQIIDSVEIFIKSLEKPEKQNGRTVYLDKDNNIVAVTERCYDKNYGHFNYDTIVKAFSYDTTGQTPVWEIK